MFHKKYFLFYVFFLRFPTTIVLQGRNRAESQEVFACAQKKGLRLDGKPFEIYEIDKRDTMWPEELLTEIQMWVEL